MSTFKIQVNRSPEDVFAYVADVTRHAEWANPKAGLKLEAVSGTGPAKGAQYRSTQTFLGKPAGADITITEYEPSSRFTLQAVHAGKKKTVTYTSAFRFTPRDGGTLVEKTLTSDGPALINALAYPAIRKDNMTSLGRLKATLESSS
jgi:uncharacterized protein YndB with AHSA1/START domain